MAQRLLKIWRRLRLLQPRPLLPRPPRRRDVITNPWLLIDEEKQNAEKK
jgi:hypothetical protein